ncbi:MAG TPA: glycosyltransferase [Aggregatilinea sp.]|uniref:glycosyltransferase n=1 Tax=Aggregatilinea sp. TaxID=2806333 RepID=UPI002BD5FB42|nr:glycosyltransferase [Aggregatilinea sp.]HML21949.1 glycosyltransferase [Aggregatilinea sp.]
MQSQPTASPHEDRRLVVVVIPTYDEKDNIADLIADILSQQPKCEGFDLEVLVSDSHSQDGTREIVTEIGAANPKVHLLDVRERGIGLGLYSGFTHAINDLGADVLIEIDADFQHNPSDIPALLGGIREGYDVVIGSRFVPGSVNQMPLHRRILSVGANLVIRTMLGLKHITEITTSYRAFTKAIFLKVDPDSVPWRKEKSFIAVPVFLVRMIDAGASAKEVPMTMHPRVRGYSKMDFSRYIRDIFVFSIKSRLGMDK